MESDCLTHSIKGIHLCGFQFVVSGVSYFLYIDTDITEELAMAIFRVEVCKIKIMSLAAR